MTDFSLFNLEKILLDNLSAMDYNAPTPIQLEAIPIALSGKDILATAQTGTGKTGAYGVAAINHLLKNNGSAVLVLTPTRELAIQVIKVLEQMIGKRSPVKTALLIGGDPISKQLSQLELKPRLIVGTPGRVFDHIERESLNLSNINFLVLDETDRMLDMGFEIQLEQIVKFIPKERQTLMFSATLPGNIQKMSTKYLVDSTRISIGSHICAADTIIQEIIKTTEAEKHGVLLTQLDIHSGSFIIFVKTKIATEKLALKLREHGHSADAIHGDLRQRNREKVIKSFRNNKYRILVATDVAARGLDIPHIEQVVNFDLPQCEEDFIHRIGRTGRAGKSGKAISLITPQDNIKWSNICKMMNPGQKIEPLYEERFKGKRDDRKFGRTTSRFGGEPSRDRRFGGDSARGDTRNRPFRDSNSDSPRRPYSEIDSRNRPFRDSNSEAPRRSFRDSNSEAPRRPFRDSNSEAPRRSFSEIDSRNRPFRDSNSEAPRRPFSEIDSRNRPFRDSNSEAPRRAYSEIDSRNRPFRDSRSDAPRRPSSEADFRNRPNNRFKSPERPGEKEGFGKRRSSDFKPKSSDTGRNFDRAFRKDESDSDKPKRKFFI